MKEIYFSILIGILILVLVYKLYRSSKESYEGGEYVADFPSPSFTTLKDYPNTPDMELVYQGYMPGTCKLNPTNTTDDKDYTPGYISLGGKNYGNPYNEFNTPSYSPGLFLCSNQI